MSDTLRKEKDVIVYRNPESYSHNAVVETLENGEIIVVVQEQQRRKIRTHVDPTSRPVLLRSTDGGNTWDPDSKSTIISLENEAINDPSIRRLTDGTLIVGYFTLRCGGDDEVPVDNPCVRSLDGEHYSWLTGTHTIRSTDNGRTWDEPVAVPAPTGDATAVSDPIIELPNGELLIPLYCLEDGDASFVVVMRSTDRGSSWQDPVCVVRDPLKQMEFSEPSLLHLPSGKLICMHRVHRKNEQEYGYYLYQSDSDDLGRTWSPVERTQIWGHPPHLLRLQSGSILCVYGYRRPPYGARACLSHDEGKTWDIQNELILRQDGIDPDVGYPTSVQLDDGTIFTVWYLCEPEQGTRTPSDDFFSSGSPLGYIGGTFYREVV